MYDLLLIIFIQMSTPLSSTSSVVKSNGMLESKSSSEELANQSTGETTSGSNGHHTDGEKSPPVKEQSPNTSKLSVAAGNF